MITKWIPQGTRRTNGQIYLDQHILKEDKTKWKNVAMAWIDNKKAYDMVLQTCLKMQKISNKIVNFIMNSTENWRKKLTTRELTLAEIKIQRGIFLGDLLSPLLFEIVMMRLNYMLRKCTEGLQINKITRKD